MFLKFFFKNSFLWVSISLKMVLFIHFPLESGCDLIYTAPRAESQKRWTIYIAPIPNGFDVLDASWVCCEQGIVL